MALVVGRAVRSRPAPRRYGLLLAGLVVVGIVPAVAAASRLAGWAFVTVPAAAVDQPLAAEAFVAAAAPRPLRKPVAVADGEFALPDSIEETAAASLRMPTFREVASCLLWVWFVGIVFFVGIVARDLVRLRRLGGSLVACKSPAVIGLLDEAARAVGLTQPPRLFESAAVPVPVVIGPVAPVIVLPKGMAHTLDREKLSAVLVHEAAHVVHGDLWVGLLQHAVAAVFWWCPPVHRLNRRLAEVREEICDDYVVVAQGDGFRLAEVLVEMAAGLRGKRERLAIGALGAIDEKPALEGRVERLVDLTRKTVPMTRMNRIAIVAAGTFGAVALAIVVATTIHAADESAVAPSPAESKSLPAAAPAAGLDADELRALDAALAWIAKRQEADGGWSLDGPKATRAGATSLAILPFLARGHDHKTPGPYREHIARGIDFLVTLVGKEGSAVKDGETMYSQGLVAMALCRAYGRTRDPALEAPAQATLDFIMAAQHEGGGWRYRPKQPGDTSALSYQIEALANGEAAGLKVKPETWAGVARFLDSVQGNDEGSTYGYVELGTGKTTTAIGLLGRLRSGWKLDKPGLVTGVAAVVGGGPSIKIYHNYHATRLVHAAADVKAWADWRASVADHLIEGQVKEGDDTGSWQEHERTDLPWSYGPLVSTSLAALTLAEPLERTMLRAK
jgi:beta-lactamase regulating signal transducer with metallopeptidase domain